MSGFSERLIGLQLGGFAIRRYIARGGMGVVYEGYQSSLDRVVAIKVLYPHLSEGAAFIERFQREARAIAQLRHPHIVQIIDTGADEGYHYMAMELIDGRSLRDELIDRQGRSEKFSTATAMQIINQIGGALAYAHRRGFVHRDIKPGNVLLDTDGGAHLSDFGLVKSLGNEGLTQAGAVLGTPEYMAPEQYMATDDVGPASDQYAFAVLAYELLAGRVPFSAPTPVAVIQQHLHEQPPSPQSFDPTLSADIEAVLLRGLAKQPAQRFPSVEAFVRDLNAAVGAATTATESPSAPAASPLADTPLIPTLAVPPAATVPRTAGGTDVSGDVPLAEADTDTHAPAESAADDRAGAAAPEPVVAAVSAASVREPARGAADLTTARGAVPPAPPLPARSRRRWLMPFAGLATLGIIGAIVAAFALGGGNGDSTPTPGDIEGQQGGVLLDSTATEEPTATLESVATETVDVAVAVDTVTPEGAVATEIPTPRPTTTAVSRPIEATATPRMALQPLPFATGTAESADGSDPSVVVYQDFSTGDPGPFFIGSSDFGDSAITDGKYTMTVPQDKWQSRVPDPPIDVANGGVALDVSIVGNGAAGIVGRLATQADGSYVLLACWLNTQGAAGCHVNVSDTWTELFSVAEGTIALQDVNRLIMVAVGDQVAFQVGDTVIGQAQTSASASGGWGMYAASSADSTVTAAFTQIVISTVSDDYLSQ